MEEERGRKYECFSLLKEKVIMDSLKLKETETEREIKIIVKMYKHRLQYLKVEPSHWWETYPKQNIYGS